MKGSTVLACLVGAVAAQRSQAELDILNKDSTCINKAFFNNLHGTCANDAACVCNQQKYRQDMFCQIARECRPEAFYDYLATTHKACGDFHIDVSPNFDTQAICGMKQPVATGEMIFWTTISPLPKPSSTSAPVAVSTPSSQNAQSTTLATAPISSNTSTPGASNSGTQSTAKSTLSGAEPSKTGEAKPEQVKSGAGKVVAVSQLAILLAGLGLAM